MRDHDLYFIRMNIFEMQWTHVGVYACHILILARAHALAHTIHISKYACMESRPPRNARTPRDPLIHIRTHVRTHARTHVHIDIRTNSTDRQSAFFVYSDIMTEIPVPENLNEHIKCKNLRENMSICAMPMFTGEIRQVQQNTSISITWSSPVRPT